MSIVEKFSIMFIFKKIYYIYCSSSESFKSYRSLSLTSTSLHSLALQYLQPLKVLHRLHTKQHIFIIFYIPTVIFGVYKDLLCFGCILHHIINKNCFKKRRHRGSNCECKFLILAKNCYLSYCYRKFLENFHFFIIENICVF